jgi:hypothetical protein
MATASEARLRLTVELAKPTVWNVPLRYKLTERGGRPFMIGPDIVGERVGLDVPLPLELLPIIHEVDLDSDERIVAFIEEFGPLGAWPSRFLAMRIPTFAAGGRVRLGPLVKAREKHAMWGEDHRGEFLDEFRVAAGGLVSLFETVLELEGELEGRRRFSADRLAKTWSPYAPWPATDPATSRRAAWWFIVDAINKGLRSLPWTLWEVRGGKPTDRRERGFTPGPPFMLHPSVPESLYGVAILELVDHLLAADRPYRLCANETCGRLFSMQEGRSTSGSHRTDRVRYHSLACKAAQESREYRRRQAAKKKGRAK